MDITHNEFKESNARLVSHLTPTQIFKPLKKTLSALLTSTEIDNISNFLSTQDMGKVDKRVTAEWLSSALSGNDYNKFIAELKAEKITEQNNDLSIDNFNFEALEQSLIKVIKGRYENKVLESELEIVLTASEVARIILGDNKWSTKMLFKSMYDQESLINEINDNKIIYWVEEVEHNGYTEEIILYSYKSQYSDKCEPSDEEYDTKEMEMYTEEQMKQTFAWNNKDNKPLVISSLLGRNSLVEGKPVLIRN